MMRCFFLLSAGEVWSVDYRRGLLERCTDNCVRDGSVGCALDKKMKMQRDAEVTSWANSYILVVYRRCEMFYHLLVFGITSRFRSHLVEIISL